MYKNWVLLLLTLISGTQCSRSPITGWTTTVGVGMFATTPIMLSRPSSHLNCSTVYMISRGNLTISSSERQGVSCRLQGTCRLQTCVPGQDTGVQQGCFFLSLFSCNFDYQLSPNFHRFVIFILLLGHTKWKYWSLTITKRVQYLWTSQPLGKTANMTFDKLYLLFCFLSLARL